MKRWNQAPLIREQAVLFSPTLDAVISEDHSVRLVRGWAGWPDNSGGSVSRCRNSRIHHAADGILPARQGAGYVSVAMAN